MHKFASQFEIFFIFYFFSIVISLPGNCLSVKKSDEKKLAQKSLKWEQFWNLWET